MFLNPWAIVLGGLAVGLPVFVHWLTRPRPVRFPVSTLRFLREALHQRRARHRLRDFIILTLRTLAIVLLALAIARPLTEAQLAAPSATEDADKIRVLLVDASQSMAARAGGIAHFERGRSLAADHLEYQPKLQANLILAGAEPRSVFEGSSTNFSALKEALASAQPLPEELNVQAALNLAAEMLASRGDATGTDLELVIVSDFQRTNWANADFSILPEKTRIELQSIVPEEPLANLAVLKVAAQGRAEVGREIRLEVAVGNYSATPRRVKAELELGGDVYVLEGSCAPQSRTTLTTDMLPRAAGWQTGLAKLVGVEDSLPDDNARPFGLEIRPPPHYVLITRQLPNKRPSSSYYLERALVPAEEQESQSSRLSRLSPDDLAPEELALADLIVVDHPGKLSAGTVNQLAALLRRGRGMLYVASEPIDATNLKLLEEAVGSGLQLPVDYLPPEQRDTRVNLLLSEPNAARAPFSVFGDHLNAAVSPLRFFGGLTTRTREGALEDDILASFSDRSAALTVARSESGALVVLNCDLERSNLYQSPIFVPLLGELAQSFLLYRTQGAQEVSCGEKFAEVLPTEVGALEGLSVAGPDSGVTALGALQQESQGIQWKGEQFEVPGVYRVVRDGETRFALAATIPAAESDLRTLSEDVFKDRLTGGRSVQFHSRSAGGQDNQHDWLWTWAALACVGCLMAEVVSLKTFHT